MIGDGAKLTLYAISQVFVTEDPAGVENMGFVQVSGSLKILDLVKAGLASSKLRLFKAGFDDLDANTTLAELDAEQCDFSGYTAGGATITAFNEVMIVGSGAQLVSPLTQFNFVTPEEDPPVTNTVGGWYLVTSAGVLIEAAAFSDGIPMATDNDSIPLAVALQAQSANP